MRASPRKVLRLWYSSATWRSSVKGQCQAGERNDFSPRYVEVTQTKHSNRTDSDNCRGDTCTLSLPLPPPSITDDGMARCTIPPPPPYKGENAAKAQGPTNDLFLYIKTPRVRRGSRVQRSRSKKEHTKEQKPLQSGLQREHGIVTDCFTRKKNQRKDMDTFPVNLSYYDVFDDMADPRMRQWPLVEDPVPLAVITGVYLAFVTMVGPKMMSYRSGFSLRKLIIAVNVFQVLINMWIVWEMARATWVSFAVKLFDLLDTVFFVLRKKEEQVSFLHLFHHVTTLWLSWLVCKYAPGGHGTFTEMLNAFIHVIMYVYYLLAAMGPQVQKYLWWKKYLTTTQMAQFVLTWVQNIHAQVTGCTYNRFIIMLYTPIITMTFLLFYNFYRKSYVYKGMKGKIVADNKSE